MEVEWILPGVMTPFKIIVGLMKLRWKSQYRGFFVWGFQLKTELRGCPITILFRPRKEKSYGESSSLKLRSVLFWRFCGAVSQQSHWKVRAQLLFYLSLQRRWFSILGWPRFVENVCFATWCFWKLIVGKTWCSQKTWSFQSKTHSFKHHIFKG